MPSSPSYKRDYLQEHKTAKKRGENKDDILRRKDRRMMMKKGLVKPSQDVDHKHALVKGGTAGTGTTDNLRAVSVHTNRSFPRTKKAGMIKNT